MPMTLLTKSCDGNAYMDKEANVGRSGGPVSSTTLNDGREPFRALGRAV